MNADLKKNLVASTISAILAGVAGLGGASPALATTVTGPCPATGYAASGCDLVITLNANGTASVAAGPSSNLASGTYDNSDDTLIGVVNNSGQTVNSIHLSGSTDIFGFDSDGVGGSSYLNLTGDSGPAHSGYSGTDSTSTSFNLSGPLNSFSNISQDWTSGEVNFGTGLVAGGSAFFSLEEPLTTASFTVTNTVPEPGSLAIFAAGLAGLAGLVGVGSMRRRRKQT